MQLGRKRSLRLVLHRSLTSARTFLLVLLHHTSNTRSIVLPWFFYSEHYAHTLLHPFPYPEVSVVFIMRLLERKEDGELSLAEFVGDNIPRYAILSHTWGADNEECTFKDLVEGTGKTKAGYSKIKFCGEQAANDNLRYFWVDTCCIDKSSSSELSEAINSMFRWYHDAVKCYVYLSDVSIGVSQPTGKPAFQQSRWFTRGWTLQELVAPTSVEFFSGEGERIGDKKSLVHEIHKRTGISVRALEGTHLSEFSVDERMSWATERQTKREEDAAYSLLGIFDVPIPLLYGEGREKAFVRLRKAIKESSMEEGSNVHDVQYRTNSSYSGPVFNGPISGRFVIPGTQVTGGTVNYNFTG
jgi:hypothetical protein